MNYSVNPELRLKLEGWRARLLLLMLGACFVVLTARAVYLQGLNNDFLQREGAARYSRLVPLNAPRGRVLDRNGELLAVSTPAEAVCASPKNIEISGAQIKTLARLIGVSEQEIIKKLTDKERAFVYLKRQLDPNQAAKVVALGVPGLFLQREWRRHYPAGPETAHLLGFTGIDDAGQEGVELSQDESLAGAPGVRRILKDGLGHPIESLGVLQEAQPGKDLTLSVDRRLQYLAYREIKTALAKERAKAAAIVVLDIKSGELLALANLPDYDPNDRRGLKPKRIRNRSVTDLFEPGSTLKPFTVALALETGKVQPESVIDTAPGYLAIGGRVIHDVHPQNKLTVAQVVQKSSNVGAAKLALQLPAQRMWNLFTEVGFGAAPESGLPGEAVGIVRSYQSWRPVEQATMSYGHGISVSLLQLARAYTIFATDGELIPVRAVRAGEASVTAEGEQVISPKTARAVRAMLELAAQPGGTALKARVPGYRVAGKTGTAHKQVGKGYAPDKYVSSFVGFAPASDPRLLIAVMIDEPSAGQHYGGAVAAPVFSRVMGGAMRILGVRPDAPAEAELIPQPDEEAREEV